LTRPLKPLVSIAALLPAVRRCVKARVDDPAAVEDLVQETLAVVDVQPPAAPDEELLEREERESVAPALASLSEQERHTLLAHEVSGQDTRSLAVELDSSAGDVSAQLNRTRARLRVEYLLALERTQPATDRCRPVLRALWSGDRRRQREVGGHS